MAPTTNRVEKGQWSSGWFLNKESWLLQEELGKQLHSEPILPPPFPPGGVRYVSTYDMNFNMIFQQRFKRERQAESQGGRGGRDDVGQPRAGGGGQEGEGDPPGP